MMKETAGEMQEQNGHRAMILDQVRIHLESRRLIDLSLTVDPGEIVTVMGPSGSGKSTLLAYLSGFLDPAFRASGRLMLCGQDVTALPAQRRRIGILFQDPLLFPHLSVGGNLAFGLSPSVKGREMRKAAHQTGAGCHQYGGL